jgi:hypothetical protein
MLGQTRAPLTKSSLLSTTTRVGVPCSAITAHAITVLARSRRRDEHAAVVCDDVSHAVGLLWSQFADESEGDWRGLGPVVG